MRDGSNEVPTVNLGLWRCVRVVPSFLEAIGRNSPAGTSRGLPIRIATTETSGPLVISEKAVN